MAMLFVFVASEGASNVYNTELTVKVGDVPKTFVANVNLREKGKFKRITNIKEKTEGTVRDVNAPCVYLEARKKTLRKDGCVLLVSCDGGSLRCRFYLENPGKSGAIYSLNGCKLLEDLPSEYLPSKECTPNDLPIDRSTTAKCYSTALIRYGPIDPVHPGNPPSRTPTETQICIWKHKRTTTIGLALVDDHRDYPPVQCIDLRKRKSPLFKQTGCKGIFACVAEGEEDSEIACKVSRAEDRWHAISQCGTKQVKSLEDCDVNVLPGRC